MKRRSAHRDWEGVFAVYRYFDRDGRLLYVGCTKNMAKRHAKHRGGSSGAWWYPRVVRTRIEVFATREAAELAERQAIAAEEPAYNLRRADGRIDDRSRWAPDDHQLHRLWAQRPGNSCAGWWRMESAA